MRGTSGWPELSCITITNNRISFLVLSRKKIMRSRHFYVCDAEMRERPGERLRECGGAKHETSYGSDPAEWHRL